ncbi:MAG: ADP-ribosylglycohydrolase family protein [Fimbriimonadaceae bacterium]|nr:ADP-ribosylglycohydrolase family protein [Fimbriimonadaceae bacterium]
MENRTHNAVLAAIAGVTLGAPRIGRNQYQKMNGYEPIPARMAPHPLLDSWIVWAKAVSEDKSPVQLGQVLLENLDDQSDETAFGMMNLRRGFGAPISGAMDNPLPDGARGLLRALFWGLTLPGFAEKATTHAYYDASIDHAGDGVWIPAAFAYALSISWPGMTASEFWEAVSSALPKQSDLHRVGPHLVAHIGHPEGPQEFANQFVNRFPDLDRNGIVATASFALLGLLHCSQNTQSAALITVGCGGQSDIATAVSCACAAFFWTPLDANFLGPLGKDYIATHALRHLTPPATIHDFAAQIEGLVQEQEIVIPESLELIAESTEESEEEQTTPEGEQAESVTEPTEEQSVEATEPAEPLIAAPSVPHFPTSLAKLLNREPDFCKFEINGAELTAHYIDLPLGAMPTRKFQLLVKNISADPDFKLSLTGPPAWQMAHRIDDCVIPVGTEVQFPAVIQPFHPPVLDPQLRLQINGLSVLIPFIKPQAYWILGPFVNIEGTGFTYVHPPEKVQSKIQVWDAPFSGRSDIGIRWAEHFSSGTEFDVEPIFNQGAGVTYLYAHMQWNQPGAMRVLAHIAGGLKVWIDGVEVLSYHDATPKPLRLGGTSTADFTTHGESHILVKVVRGNSPIPPLQLAFFDETGKVVFPAQFLNQK